MGHWRFIALLVGIPLAILLGPLASRGHAGAGQLNNVDVSDFLEPTDPTTTSSLSIANSGILTGRTDGSSTVIILGGDGNDRISNSGIIEGVPTGPNGVGGADAIDGGGGAFDLLRNSGQLDGNVQNIEVVENTGLLQGNLFDVTFVANSGSIVDARFTAAPSVIPGVVKGFFQSGDARAHDIHFEGVLEPVFLRIQGGSVENITLEGSAPAIPGSSNEILLDGSLIDRLTLGRNDALDMYGGVIRTVLDLNGGTDRIDIWGGSILQIVDSVGGPSRIHVRASGIVQDGIHVVQNADYEIDVTGTVEGLIETGAGNDQITMNGLHEGGIDAGGGNNNVSVDGIQSGGVKTGSGMDRISVRGIVSGDVEAGDLVGPDAENTILIGGRVQGVLGGNGRDMVVIAGETGSFVTTREGDDLVLVPGIIEGSLSTDAGDDVIEVSGKVGLTQLLPDSGSIEAGEGNDRVEVATGAVVRHDVRLDAGEDTYIGMGRVDGNVIGGSGNDVLDFRLGSIRTIQAGAGDDSVKLILDAVDFTRLDSTEAGDGGAGTDTLSVSTSSDQRVTSGRFVNFETARLVARPGATLIFNGGQNFRDVVSLEAGTMRLENGDFLDGSFAHGNNAGPVADFSPSDAAFQTASLAIAPSTVLEGAGLIRGSVTNGGLVSPGTDLERVGQISIQGNYRQDAGSSLVFDVRGPGLVSGVVASSKTQDLVRIQGTVTLNGGTLKVRTNGDSFRAITRWAVFDTTGGVTGTPLTAEVVDATNLSAVTSITGSALDLVLKRTDLDFASSVSEDPFVGRYGPILNDALARETPELLAFINELSLLGPAERGSLIQSAFINNPLISIGQFTTTVTRRLDMMRTQVAATPDAAAGTDAGKSARAGTLHARMARLAPSATMLSGFTSPLDAINSFQTSVPQAAPQRVRTARAARKARGEKVPDEESADAPPAEPADPVHGVWAQAFGTRSERDFGIPFRLQGSGFTLGYDHTFSDRFTAGLFAGSSDSDGHQGIFRTQTQHVESRNHGAYGSYTRNQWYLDAVYDHGDYDIAAKRLVAAGSTLFSSAADYEAKDDTFYLEGGWLYEPSELLFFQPLASLQYRHFQQDRISESGGVAGVMVFDPLEFSTLQSGLGIRTFRVFGSPDGTLFIPEVRARWLHNFDHEGLPVSQTIGSTGSRVTFRTEEISDENTGQIQVGISAFAPGNVEFNGNYYGEFGQNTEIHSATATVAYRF